MDLHHEIEGTGSAVVLLHPVGLDSSFWGDLPSQLARRHKVVRVDLAGHGRSPDAPRPGRMHSNVEDVSRLIERLDIGPVAIVGLSFGGMIAQNIALERPDLVGKLVLAGCPPRIPETGRGGILARGKVAEEGGMEAVVDTTLERWFSPPFRETAAAEDVAARLRSNKPSNWAAAWEAVSEHDALDRLPEIEIRTLVIAGESDEATPLDAKKTMANALPDARLKVLPGAPHMMQIECESDFVDAVLEFLSEDEQK